MSTSIDEVTNLILDHVQSQNKDPLPITRTIMSFLTSSVSFPAAQSYSLSNPLHTGPMLSDDKIDYFSGPFDTKAPSLHVPPSIRNVEYIQKILDDLIESKRFVLYYKIYLCMKVLAGSNEERVREYRETYGVQHARDFLTSEHLKIGNYLVDIKNLYARTYKKEEFKKWMESESDQDREKRNTYAQLQEKLEILIKLFETYVAQEKGSSKHHSFLNITAS